MNTDENIRYERQLIMPEIGQIGQSRLSPKTVAIIGCGGLGSLNILYLAAIGIGKLILVDDDIVEESNLNRQLVHNIHDIGEKKVLSAAQKIHLLNPNVEVKAVDQKLSATNIDAFLKEADIIVDAVDNLETRYLLDEYSTKKCKPIVFAAVEGFKGFIYTKLRKKSIPYTKLFPTNPQPRKGKIGVFGAGVGIVSSVECVEVIKYLLEKENCSKIINIDMLANNQEVIELDSIVK